MAKQRGIHQISGKINNLCYYEQKYVRGGLIRRINEAMSERLKTDPVFANTRRANTIFGGCSVLARCLLDFFGSRNTYLFKPYRHALLTKLVLTYFVEQNDESQYPSILVGPSSVNVLPAIIDGIVKNKIRDSFPELPNMVYGLSINGEHTFVFSYQSLLKFCSKYKCKGVQISLSKPFCIYAPYFDSSIGKYVEPDYNPGGRVTYSNIFIEEINDDVEFTVSTGSTDDALTFWVIYATPILFTIGDRPVTGETGASCGVVTFRAQ